MLAEKKKKVKTLRNLSTKILKQISKINTSHPLNPTTPKSSEPPVWRHESRKPRVQDETIRTEGPPREHKRINSPFGS